MKVFIYIMFIFSVQISTGQLSDIELTQIDSYKQVITSKQHDTLKLVAYAAWEELIYEIDPELSLTILKSIDSICNKNLNLDLSTAESLFFKKNKAQYTYTLGNYHKDIYEFPTALLYYSESKQQFKNLGDKKGLAALLNNEGLVQAEVGNYQLALENYEVSIELFKAAGDSAGWANSLTNVAIISANVGDYDQAISYFTQCLTIDESMGYTEGVASGLNNIGIVYTDFGKFDKALDYFDRSYKLRLKQEDISGQAVVQNNIGNVYFLMDSNDLSLKYYEKGKRLSQQIEDKIRLLESLNGIGQNYVKKGLFLESRSYLEEALTIGQALGSDYNVSATSVNLAESYAGTGHYAKAIDLAENGLELGTEIGALYLIKNASEMLYKWNKKTGNSSEALAMHEIFISMNDSIMREENQMEIINQEYKYQYEKQKALDDAENEKQKLLEKARTDAALLVEKEKEQKQRVLIYSISGGLVLVISFLLFIFNRLKITRAQKDEINDQKSTLDVQHKELAETHREMRESIHYAKYLQTAILPSLEEIHQHLGTHFILYKPKDVISGDFYWFERINGVNYIAAADCTGHGVPGALLCVVCSNALNRSVNEFGLKNPSEILDNAREIVIETLGKKGAVRDGMDISLGAMSKNKLVFSGANNPLWITRKVALLNDEDLNKRGTVVADDLALIEFKGDKQPVGFYPLMKAFTQIEVELFAGDRIYFFSDGYIDQFGGDKGKKFKSLPFKRLMLETAKLSIDKQKEHLSTTFDNWKGKNEQVDDVCVIAIEV